MGSDALNAFLELDIHAMQRESSLKNWSRLNQAMVDILLDYDMVRFYPLEVESKERMQVIIAAIDRANGNIFGGLEKDNACIFEVAVNEQLLL